MRLLSQEVCGVGRPLTGHVLPNTFSEEAKHPLDLAREGSVAVLLACVHPQEVWLSKVECVCR